VFNKNNTFIFDDRRTSFKPFEGTDKRTKCDISMYEIKPWWLKVNYVDKETSLCKKISFDDKNNQQSLGDVADG
jgi:hypothetical protein